MRIYERTRQFSLEQIEVKYETRAGQDNSSELSDNFKYGSQVGGGEGWREMSYSTLIL